MSYRATLVVLAAFYAACSSTTGTSSGPRVAGAPAELNATFRSGDVKKVVNLLENQERDIFRQRDQIAAFVAPRQGAVVADVGAGTGFMTLKFAEQVGPTGKVFAVEISQALLDAISKRSADAGLTNVVPVLAGNDSANLEPGSVDLIFLCDTYHHLEEPEALMRSLHSALRPGGELVLVDIKRAPDVKYSFRDWAFWEKHLRGDQEQFVSEIVSFGFAVVEQHQGDASFLSDSYVVRFRRD